MLRYNGEGEMTLEKDFPGEDCKWLRAKGCVF